MAYLVRPVARLCYVSPIALVLLIALSGCGCTEYVKVTNDTTSPLLVQLALPWPSYTVASPGGCHFEFDLMPGESWSTKNRRSDDRADLDVEVNGLLVFQVWPKETRGPYSVFQGDIDDWAEIVIRREDTQFAVVGRDKDGQSLPFESATFDWFKDE